MKRILFTFAIALAVFGAGYGVHAQTAPAQQQPEAKYVTITVDETSTSKQAEDVARAIMKDEIAFHTKAVGSEPKIFAVYDSLNTENKFGYLLVVLYGPTACASQGCETYVFQNLGKNKWQQVIKNTSNQIWRDKTHKPADIAMQGGNAPAMLWRWDGKRDYTRVQ